MVTPRGAKTDASTTTRRILEAAKRSIAASGAATLSMQDVAVDAGVSKALIHYHFHDKDTLLAKLVEHLVNGLVAREREVLAAYANQHNPLAVDALWQWVDEELHRGDIRVLLELDAYRGKAVQAAARQAATRRREIAAETVARLFEILDLRPRVAASLLGNVVVAFLDGLAIDTALADAESDASADRGPPRVAFDVFWLAMLSLAE